MKIPQHPWFRGFAAAICGFATLLPATAQPSAGKGNARAREVLTSLRSRLPEAARVNGIEEHALEALLKRDGDLWIDADSRLFYACEGLVVNSNAAALTAAAAATSATAIPNSTDAFKLHSLPGAPHVIYLDFNGHVTSGTAWNSSKTGGADIVSAPFDFDGNPTNWSTDELNRIKAIWQRVAEDYMPFAIDVTTEDPGVEALRKTSSTDDNYGVRVVISPSSAWYGNAGGVAYIGSFNWNSDTPAFVFSDKLGPNGEKYVAEAIAHEVGHTLGLSHDGATDGTQYYAGQGNWAPIMGVGYYKPITQWSKGEYPLANNLEDDLAKMPNYGATKAVDDYGNTIATAAPLTGPSVMTLGVIETAADVDVFRFNTGAGAISFTISGTSPEPDLDIKAELLDANGNVLQSSDPAGLAASISATVASGTYYLRVQGVGAGDLTTGYSDYASVGEYKITGTLVPTAGLQNPIAVVGATPTSGTAPLTVTFSSSGSSDPDGSIVSYAWNFGDGSTSNEANPVHLYSSQGSYTATLTVTDNNGLTGMASTSIVATAAPNQLPTAAISASVTSGTVPLTVAFSSTGSSDPDGSITAYFWDFGDGTNSTAANPSKTYTSVGTFTAKLTVTDDRNGTASASQVITVTADVNKQIDVNTFTLSAQSNSAGAAAIASIKVLDRLGQPVAGAIVNVTWSGLASGSGSGTTDSSGVAQITSKRTKRAGSITATISSVTPPSGYTYNASLYSAPTTQSITVN